MAGYAAGKPPAQGWGGKVFDLRRSAACAALLLLCAVCTQLSGCEQVWAFRIEQGGETPVFLFARTGWFETAPVPLDNLTIDEVDGNNPKVGDTWLIEPGEGADDHVLGRVRYGETPPDWKTIEPPQKLKVMTWYSVNGRYFFRRKQNGEYQVLDSGEFAEVHG